MAHVILVQRERKAGQGSLVFGGPRSFLLPDSALPVVLIMLLYVVHTWLGPLGHFILHFPQGCSIGCDFCLTDPRHPANNNTIPTKVDYNQKLLFSYI